MSVIATEVTHEELMEEHLPLLLRAAGNIGHEFDLLRKTPQATVSPRR